MGPETSPRKLPVPPPRERIPSRILDRWQRLVDLMAQICGVPAGLIMRVDPPQIEVFLRSRTNSNPYEPDERADLDTGLYCEEVMRRRGELRVLDALADPDWDKNPDIALGMTYYLGYPLEWPDGSVFGTICILDREGHPDDVRFKQLMQEFQQVLQADLELVVESERRHEAEQQLLQRQDELETLLRERSSEAALARRDATKSELTLHTVVDHLPAAVFLKDPDGRYQQANAFLHDMLGMAPGTIVGLLESDMHGQEQALRFRAQDAEVVERGLPMRFEEEVEIGGRTRYFLTTKTPFRTSADQAPGVLGVALDLTDLKEAEAEREGLEEQLRQTRKMEAIGRLAGGIAHDFNNLLTAILGQAELALADGSPASAQEALEAVQSSALRAAQLTGQLLAFGRRQVSQPRPLDLNLRLEEVRSLLARMLPENIHLQLDLAPDLGPVQADPSQLEQVVINLVLNARDAMPTGGALALATESRILTKTEADLNADLLPGPHALLTVRDEGCGMSTEVLERIFEPFYTP